MARGGLSEEYVFLTCYADYAVQEYILGAGPASVTVAYDRMGEAHSYELYRVEHGAGMFGSVPRMSEGEYAERLDGIVRDAEAWLAEMVGGRESVVMLAPMGAHNAIAVEAWQAIEQWDLQEDEDEVVHAVRYGAPEGDPEQTQTLANLKTRITTAAGSDAFATTRIANVSGLTQYYRDIGAYGDITPGDGSTATFTPAQPPPAYSCAGGTAVTSPAVNFGLVHDCEALFDGKDALRGAGSLNWSTATAIGSWDGITTRGSPTRVKQLLLPSKSLTGTIPAGLGSLFALTHLDLSGNRLTGDIPAELGWLHNLEEVRLSGNRLTGCIPIGLRSVPTNDLSSLNLPYCRPPAPGSPRAGTAGETSVPLTWAAATNVSKYRVEHRETGLAYWEVDDEAVTGTSYTVDELRCTGRYEFRLSAFGSGTGFGARWSDPSLAHTASTASCTPPEFGQRSYAFSVMDDAAMETAVGTVAATDTSGEPVTYAITAGNEDGAFAIDENSGAVTVAGSLRGQAGTTVRLTVAARDAAGGAAEAPVAVAVTNSCASGTAAPDPAANARLVQDCRTLLGLMSALAGTASLNWSPDLAMTSWDGITVGGTPQRVTQLELERQALNGVIPEAVGDLAALERLQLGYNQLTGEIPTALGQLTRVTNLRLNDNQLAGSIPAALGQLTRMTDLRLNNNRLTGEIPAELGNLTNVVFLYLNHNALTGEIPAALGNLTAVHDLWLHDNALTGEIPAALGGATRLGRLWLANNRLGGTIPAELAGLEELTLLILAGNMLEGCVPPGLRDVDTNDLGSLGLADCQAGPPAPGNLAATLTDATFALTWDAVSGVVRYEPQVTTDGAEAATVTWTALDEVATAGAPYTGMCETAYRFRVRAFGDGYTYPTHWGEASSATEAATTRACNRPPEFAPEVYAFSVDEEALAGTAVGMVSATDPDDGDTLSYAITAGNGAGHFAVDGGTGEITVAGALDYETTPSYTLTVEARDNGGLTDTAMVTVRVTDVVWEGEVELWSGVMTTAEFVLGHVDAYGYTTGVTTRDVTTEGVHGTLDVPSFSYGGETYTIELATFFETLDDGTRYFILGLEEGLLPEGTEWVLYVNEHRLTGWRSEGLPPIDTHYSYTTGFDFSLEAGQEVRLSLRKTNPSADSGLGSLSLSAGTLSPAFDAGTTAYAATVDNSVTTVAVTAEAASAYGTVTVTPDGSDDPGTGETEVTLAVGENTITVTVTAEDGTRTTYSLTVTRLGA